MRVNTGGARCPGCRLHPSICMCDVFPTLQVRTRLTVVLHADELNKPTNTGGLAARCLVGSRIVPYGLREPPLTAPVVSGDEHAVLLFPSEDATPLAEFAADGRPVHLVVPDGTWRQAARMRVRVPGLATLPRVSLPMDAPSRYELRLDERPGHFSTLEAIASALRILEGDQGEAVADALHATLNELIRRMRARRGFDPRAHG